MLTIGHSNRPLPGFLEMLTAHGVQLLVDVRSFPMSRHNPQFNKDSLPEALSGVGIEYRHMPGLGGMRRPRPDSLNTGWRNPHFRGYADYMQTPAFQAHLLELIQLGAQKCTSIMCAEAVPWRCHRSLMSDALTARQIPVFHILSPTRADAHRLTAFARIEGQQVNYPAETLDLFPET